MLNRSPEITRRKQAPWNRLPVERLSGLAADDAVGRAGGRAFWTGRPLLLLLLCGLKRANNNKKKAILGEKKTCKSTETMTKALDKTRQFAVLGDGGSEAQSS